MVARVRSKKRHKGNPDWKPGISPNPHGRPKGSLNKTSRFLKEAALRAAELEGSNQRGRDGLIGFLRMASRKETAAFLSLLGKILPLQITGEGGKPIELISSGMPVKQAAELYAETIRQFQAGVTPKMIDVTPVRKDEAA